MRFILLVLLLVLPSLAFSQKKVNFSKAYQKENAGTTKIEVNEAQELMYIMLAITPAGVADSNMIEHTTDYYLKVRSHFDAYKQHPMISIIDSLVKKSLLQYYFLTVNAYGFRFAGDTLTRTGVYNLPAREIANVTHEENSILTYKKQIEDFSKKSGYRNFYQQNQVYYKSLIEDYEQFANLKKQKGWLETHFKTRIQSFKILCSPLIAGMNATEKFEDNGYIESLMFLPAITQDSRWSKNFTEAINTRFIFTEIDHNYVGAPSDKHKKTIDKIFSNRNKWVDAKSFGTEYYPNPVKVFNEYMTYAVFLLYCQDNFKNDTTTLNRITKNVENLMVERGFINFKKFSEHLNALYAKSRKNDIEALYPSLLAWCASQ